MSQEIENQLNKIPVIKWVVRFLKSIQLPGLKGLSLYDLSEMYVLGIINGALSIRASAVAFSFFMAIFPFLLFIIILMPYIPIESFQSDFLSLLEASLPPNTSDFFNQNIFEKINKKPTGLLSSVFIVSMLLMSNGVNAVFSGFENSYHQKLNRNFINQYLYAFGVSIILVLILISTIIGFGFLEIYVLHPIYKSLNLGDATSELEWLLRALKFLFFVMMIYLVIAVLYFFGTKDGKLSRFFSVGALLTTLLILLNSSLFGIYIENFSTYNQLYGSIGALLILLFYLWLNAIILLLGFELNASLQRLKKSCQ